MYLHIMHSEVDTHLGFETTKKEKQLLSNALFFENGAVEEDENAECRRYRLCPTLTRLVETSVESDLSVA